MTSPSGSQFLLNKLEALNVENEKLRKEKEDLQTKLDNERSRSLINIKTQVTVDELQDKVKNLKLTKTESDTKVQRLEDELRQVTAELTNKKNELDAARSDTEKKQQQIQSYKTESEGYKTELEVLRKQQDNELSQKGHMLESQKAELERTITTKDNELSKVTIQLQQLSSEMNERIAEKDKELRDLNGKLYAKDVKINELTARVSEEKSHAQSFYGNQLSVKDQELAALNHNYAQLQQQNNKKDETIQQLNTNMRQANERIRKVEGDKHNEVQKLSSDNSNLKSSVKSYENQLSEKDRELQSRLAELEQLSKNFSTLQKRFKNVVSEKEAKEMELTKELEDSLSTLDTYAKQIPQGRGEINKLKQVIGQKDEEIQKLMEREQSAQHELKIRAEKVKADEMMVTELKQKNSHYQRQLKEYESKCEKLEGEVNRVNAQRLAGKNTRELAADEVITTSIRHGTLDQQKFQRHGSDSDPPGRGGGYNRVPLNQNQAQYQLPLQEASIRYGEPPDRRGYGPIPGQTAGDPRSPPHNQGQPLGNMRSPPGNPPYGTPPGNQFNPGPQYQPAPGPMNQAGGRQQPQDQQFMHTGPPQANLSAELKSDPCPMCQKRFANSGQLAVHAATCNYDPEYH